MTHEELKTIRLKLGISQKEFGLRLFRTRDSIAKYESGKFNIPAYLNVLINATFNDYSWLRDHYDVDGKDEC